MQNIDREELLRELVAAISYGADYYPGTMTMDFDIAANAVITLLEGMGIIHAE